MEKMKEVNICDICSQAKRETRCADKRQSKTRSGNAGAGMRNRKAKVENVDWARRIWLFYKLVGW